MSYYYNEETTNEFNDENYLNELRLFHAMYNETMGQWLRNL